MIGQNKVLAVIPARYASSRFPGKPLVDIAGKSMTQRVYEQVKKATSIDQIVVATDDERIVQHVQAIGGNAVLTSSDHTSGTDRCFEALQLQNEAFDVVINVQGDEPFIHPEQIEKVARCFSDVEVDLATLVKPIDNPEVHFESGMVFVILDKNMNALYFSRSVIPYVNNVERIRLNDQPIYHEHVGIYGYRSGALARVTALEPSKLERTESLEQLRWLENSYKVRTASSTHESHCIDTPEDLENVLKLIDQGIIKP